MATTNLTALIAQFNALGGMNNDSEEALAAYEQIVDVCESDDHDALVDFVSSQVPNFDY